MPGDLEIQIDATAFLAAAEKLLATSKRDPVAVLREQAKGVIREVIALTPPGRPGAAKARGRGTAKVKADILKLVRGTASEARVERHDIAAIHAAARRRGRVARELNPRIVVPAEALRAYIKAKQERVGRLASGWSAAAAELGYKPPAWIARNDGPGSIEIRVTDSALVIRATNRVAYASEISQLNRRVQAALNLQRGKMERRVASYLERAARDSGFR